MQCFHGILEADQLFSFFFSAVTAVTYKVTSREVTSRDREVTSRDREAQPKLLAPSL